MTSSFAAERVTGGGRPDRTELLQGAGGAEIFRLARERERAGHEIIHLEVGEPEEPTPPHVVEAAVAALRAGATRYVEAAGLPALRAAIAESARARGIQADAANVVVTSGAKAALFDTILATVDAGDEVLVPDPGYPVIAAAVRFAGGRPVAYRVRPGGASAVDAEAVGSLVTRRTRLLVLNSPHNPTGTVLAPADLDALAELALRYELLVLSDEVYSRHVFDGTQESIASRAGMAERTAVVDGFSKAYGMTGWRLGYAVLPRALAERVVRVVAHSTTCVPPFVQHGGLAALAAPAVDDGHRLPELRHRRDLLVGALRAVPGVACETPGGALYAFPDVHELLRHTGLTTQQFAERLLLDHDVACVPGSVFGAGGDGHLRLSFAAPARALGEAVRRIALLAYGT